jgi:type IV pilus assembly protein PilC
MMDQPKIFTKILVNMVEAGEATGKIDEALDRMAVQFEKEEKINRRMKGAMMYPLILLIMTVLVATGLIIFVIPMFTDMFEQSGGELPGLTKFVVNLSHAMINYWYIFGAVIFGAVFGIKKWLKSEVGRFTLDKFKLTNKVLKKPMTQITTARFTRTLSTMLQSGISLLQAISSAAETSNNVYVSGLVQKASQSIKAGAPLSTCIRQTGIFPEMMVSLIGIGEETGELDNMLGKAAEYYDDEFEAGIANLLAMIEPIMIVFMAGIIGVIVIAMYLPIFEMVGQM